MPSILVLGVATFVQKKRFVQSQKLLPWAFTDGGSGGRKARQRGTRASCQ